MNLNELAREVHQNAVEHGWWNPEPSFPEIIALCHSELSEALEEYRAGNRTWWPFRPGDPTPLRYYSGGGYNATEPTLICTEPRGMAVELGDCILRILDWFGKEELDADRLVECTACLKASSPCTPYNTFAEMIAFLHVELSFALCVAQFHVPDSTEQWMAECIMYIMDWADAEGVDMEAILQEKLEYNKGRPYRHGGKLL